MTTPGSREDVRLARYPNEVEAQIWAEMLRREGVPVVIVPLGVGAGGWGVTTTLPHELRVRTADLARAEQLLNDLSQTL